jgi:hypothetical protein
MKQDTFMREALPADLKLQIALQYLATDWFSTLNYMYLVPKTITSRCIPKALASISESLKEQRKHYGAARHSMYIEVYNVINT